MMLLLDIGNTNLRWTLSGAGTHGEVRIVRHGGAVPIDLLADWERLDAPERVVASNVGGASVASAIGRATRAYWGLDVEFVQTRARFGALQIAYRDPERFGVDRWLALVAAHRLVAEAVLVVDAGTAATFDLLLADGRHLGGLILPGVEMMRASLLAGTLIPRIASEPTDEPWAVDTGPAVAAGSLQALAALATRLYDRLRQETQAPPALILTGGDAERLVPAMDRPCRVVPDLVLRGLSEVVSGEVVDIGCVSDALGGSESGESAPGAGKVQ
ncbi:type III pantothenate kinase [Thiocapsa bogorovii]|uniref:type III pantothenate kinase n=1 Tax=Thiocapsa bogorovii TaxID=521689 RepID=UPI001E3C6FDE|nr:type III pantothenate kinase [Thiocapsa bogorovii]UHD18160.1 type III pantothenate kinase [Thiocapsa bogorovii]